MLQEWLITFTKLVVVGTTYLIINKISMVSCVMLHKIDWM